MDTHSQLQHTSELIKQERIADLEYYRNKVLLRSLSDRTKEGTTWYPVSIKRDYIGTGERLNIEIGRTNHLDQPHAFQSGRSVNIFSNATGRPERDHVSGVVNYVRDNTMIITMNADELPDWVNDGLLGVDVMFDEISYREMEFALKEVLKAEGNRVSFFRELLLGKVAGSVRKDAVDASEYEAAYFLNDSQQTALKKVMHTDDVAFIHGPPGTGKTTTLVECIRRTVRIEGQVLVCAPSNAAVDLLAEKCSDIGLTVLRIGHPARVTEQTLSKTMDARIAAHQNYGELRELRKRIEQVRTKAYKYKRHFGFHEKQERRLLLQEVKQLKADADMLEFYIINDLLNRSQVICSTLVGASHPVLRYAASGLRPCLLMRPGRH